MKKHKILIIQMVQFIVEIDANSKKEAVIEAEKKYHLMEEKTIDGVTIMTSIVDCIDD